MFTYKCMRCGKEQFSSASNKANEPCVYCGYPKTKLWEPQDLLDDLKEMIAHEVPSQTNDRFVTLNMAHDYLKEFFEKDAKESGKKMKKVFKIPVTWEVCSLLEVEAESIDEAIRMVINDEDSKGEQFELPTDSSYVDNSFRISKLFDKEDILAWFN